MDDGIVLSISTWALLSSTILPILVGVVTKELAHSGVRATLLALLSAVNGAVSSAIQNEGILTSATVSAAFISFVVAVATYYGFLKPTDVSPKLNHKTKEFGIG